MKKLLSLILTLSMIFTLGGIPLTANASSLQENPTALGDLDGDGRASAKDALLIMGAVVKLRTFNDNQKKCADINGDNKVTSSDSLLVLRYTVGLSTNGAQLLKDVRIGSDFSAYTGPYYCTVGRGASRYTMITLNADGTFTGVYSESILYDRDSGYDYTIYYNEFSGSFDGLTSTDTYEYGTRVKSFNLKYTPNTSEIKTGDYGQKIRYFYMEPSFIREGDQFKLYIEGTPKNILPEDFFYLAPSESEGDLPYDALYNCTNHSLFRRSN